MSSALACSIREREAERALRIERRAEERVASAEGRVERRVEDSSKAALARQATASADEEDILLASNTASSRRVVSRVECDGGRGDEGKKKKEGDEGVQEELETRGESCGDLLKRPKIPIC